MSDYSILEKNLGVTFKDKNLLVESLTHSSYANEHNTKHNERLEFLGDAVLELCMSNYLFNNYKIAEGQMTKKRATYVCEDALVVYALKIHLNDYLLLGHGEEASGGRDRRALIADAFEAVIGAVFLDQGFDAVNSLFNKIVIPHLNIIEYSDSKSQLQELVQADKRTINYEIIREFGPSHDKTFEAIVKLEGDIVLGHGVGKTKKEAEQNAAFEALKKIAK